MSGLVGNDNLAKKLRTSLEYYYVDVGGIATLSESPSRDSAGATEYFARRLASLKSLTGHSGLKPHLIIINDMSNVAAVRKMIQLTYSEGIDTIVSGHSFHPLAHFLCLHAMHLICCVTTAFAIFDRLRNNCVHARPKVMEVAMHLVDMGFKRVILPFATGAVVYATASGKVGFMYDGVSGDRSGAASTTPKTIMYMYAGDTHAHVSSKLTTIRSNTFLGAYAAAYASGTRDIVQAISPALPAARRTIAPSDTPGRTNEIT
jgi:hypothetical protein